MPLSALKSHFGASGELLQRYASGVDDRAVEPPGAAKSISRETTFGKDTRDRSLLKATLRYLGERVGAELRQRGKQARCVTLKLRYADFTTITRRHTLSHASDSDQSASLVLGYQTWWREAGSKTCWIPQPRGRSY